MLSAVVLWVKWNHQIKFKNYCVSFRVSCLETTAGRHVFVISCCSLFPTPSICPADLWLVAFTILHALPVCIPSLIPPSRALPPLFSLLGCWLFSLCLFLSVQAFFYSLGLSCLLIPEPSIFPFLNTSVQRPPTALSLNLSPPCRLGMLALVILPGWQLENWTFIRSVFTSTSWYQHECSANPDGNVARLGYIYYANCF